MSQETLRYLGNKISNLLGRAILKNIKQVGGKIFAQVETRNGLISDVELLQQYGFKSMPEDGARGILNSYDGARDNSSLTNVDDKRYGKFDLSKGDVMVYNSDGSRTIYVGDNIITVADGEYTVTVGSTVFKVSPSGVDITGDLTVTGTITGVTDVVVDGKSLDDHDHPITSGSSAGTTGPNN